MTSGTDPAAKPQRGLGAGANARLFTSAALLVYFALVLVGGALLAPLLYWLAQEMADVIPTIARQPFPRFTHRSMLVLALVGFWPLVRVLGFKSASDLGIVRPSGQWQRLLAGFVLAFVSLALISAIVLAAEARVMSENITLRAILARMAFAVPTAFVVATLEEIVFRGALLGVLRRAFTWPTALVLSSAIFASLHFLRGPDFAGPVMWYSGLDLLPQMPGGSADGQKVVPTVFTLFLVGILLGWAYDWTRTLYLSIGLHAGGIVWIKMNLTFTAARPDAASWFWGTGAVLDGWLAVGLLALAIVVLVFSTAATGRATRAAEKSRQ